MLCAWCAFEFLAAAQIVSVVTKASKLSDKSRCRRDGQTDCEGPETAPDWDLIANRSWLIPVQC